MNKKGFTLVEMLVVIAIIAVLVAIIVPTAIGATNKASASANAANLRSYAAEMAIWSLTEVGDVPSKPAGKGDFKDAIVKCYNVNGECKAYFVKDSKYYGVDYFAAIAEGNTGTVLNSVSGVEIKKSGSN